MYESQPARTTSEDAPIFLPLDFSYAVTITEPVGTLKKPIAPSSVVESMSSRGVFSETKNRFVFGWTMLSSAVIPLR